jgi:hypothetical protein
LENLKERDHLKHLDVDGRITIKWILGKGSKGVDWIHVFEVRDLWWALANMILNLQDP